EDGLGDRGAGPRQREALTRRVTVPGQVEVVADDPAEQLALQRHPRGGVEPAAVDEQQPDVRTRRRHPDQLPSSFGASHASTWSSETRSWAIVSRSRMVTAWSSRVSKSTVM